MNLVRRSHLENALNAAELGCSEPTVDWLIRACLREGDSLKAMKAAELRHATLTSKELGLLSRVQMGRALNGADVRAAFEVARVRSKPLSSAEKRSLGRNFAKRKWRFPGSTELVRENAFRATYHARFGYLESACNGASWAARDTIFIVIELLAEWAEEND